MRPGSMFSIGIVLSVLAPTAAFVLHDLVFQLPDNQHQASLGFFATIFGLLFVWALSGYLAGRRTRNGLAAMSAGVITGILSVGILSVTSFVLEQLFTDRMSYEPDRMRAFMTSGYPTMREYLAHQGVGPMPLLLGVAVIAGIVGSLLGENRKRRMGV